MRAGCCRVVRIHSDYGCVTLLLADGTKGALQAWVEGDGGEDGWVVGC